MADHSELLAAEEVAEYVGVRVITVYEWCRQGRLPCLKLGKVWRIRRAALDDFLERSERHPSLVGQLRSFLRVPDYILAVAETTDLLYALDVAFFQVGEARDGLLVKFHGGQSDPEPVIREQLARHGLELERLEAAGRLRLTPEADPRGGRAAAMRALMAAEAASGRAVWASFNWQQQVDLETLLQEQAALAAVVGAGRAVVKTAALEAVADAWSAGERRRARHLHGGLIELSEGGLALTRRTPLAAT